METITKKKQNLTTRNLILVALMSAILCIFGPLALPIPMSPVPISLTNLVLYFIVFILGMRLGTLSCLIYLLIGIVGLPVFSGFAGGIGKLAGPTGGYLIGFLFLTLIAGYCIDKFPGKLPIAILGMILGTAVCYAFGTLWLAKQLHLNFIAALGVGVIPYLPGDILKIIIASILAPTLKKAVSRI